MVDALNPMNQPADQTQTRADFEALIDRAYLQWSADQGPARPPVAEMYAYAGGGLGGEERSAFEALLERSPKTSQAVFQALKTARPSDLDAPLDTQLKSTITRRLLTVLADDPASDADRIIRSFSAACHEAVLATTGDAAFAHLRGQLIEQNDGRAPVTTDSFSGPHKALALGAVGQLDEALELWKQHGDHPRAAALTRSIKLQDESSSSDVISDLSSRLASCRGDRARLLEALHDFARS